MNKPCLCPDVGFFIYILPSIYVMHSVPRTCREDIICYKTGG